MNEEKKPEYRIVSEPHRDRGICYIAERYKPLFRWMWYWEKLDDDWIGWRYSKFKYKEDAEGLIKRYKNNNIEEKDFGVEWYY